MNNHSVSSFNKLQRPSCTWLFPSNYRSSLLLTYTHIRTCSHTRVHDCPSFLTHSLNPPQLCTALHLSSASGLQKLTFFKGAESFHLLKKKNFFLKRQSRLLYHRIDFLKHNAINILRFFQVMHCTTTE